MELSPWYLLYCKRSEQERAEQHLQRQGVTCYYPKVLIEKTLRGKKQAKLEPLFPNYIFIQFQPETISFTTIRSTRGVANFVRIGIEPCVVPNELVEMLKSNERGQADEASQFSPGEAVTILQGPYAGAEAIYKESDGELRAILFIKMLNQQVELSAEKSNISKKA